MGLLARYPDTIIFLPLIVFTISTQISSLFDDRIKATKISGQLERSEKLKKMKTGAALGLPVLMFAVIAPNVTSAIEMTAFCLVVGFLAFKIEIYFWDQWIQAMKQVFVEGRSKGLTGAELQKTLPKPGAVYSTVSFGIQLVILGGIYCIIGPR